MHVLLLSLVLGRMSLWRHKVVVAVDISEGYMCALRSIDVPVGYVPVVVSGVVGATVAADRYGAARAGRVSEVTALAA